LNNITAFLLFINAILIFLLPRRFVLVPILVAGIILPMSERILIADLDFTAIRILLVCGWVRLIIRSEYHSAIKMNIIDKTMIVYVFWTVLSYVIMWQTVGSLIYKLGGASYFLGTYFLVRFYIADLEDVERIIKALLYLSIVIAIVVVIERITQHNYFSFLGGVLYSTIVREGKLRCFGPFSHPITLGSFGAFLLPLGFYLLWREKGSKKLGFASLISSVFIVYSSSSSGPIFSILASIFGLFMWRFRKHMRGIVWGTIICMIGLHFVMKAPVWALIGRVGVFSSSSYYHRFLLIDNFIKRFNEWWFIGVKDTAHWNEYIQTWDVSNNYVRVGVDGGLLAFVLFITIIVLSFRNIGKMVRLAEDSMNHQKLFWSLGVAMFSYVVSFLGVSLWDQTIIVWYFIIAVIASLQYESSTAANPLEETAPTALQNGLTV
jgi:hypothetical protein